MRRGFGEQGLEMYNSFKLSGTSNPSNVTLSALGHEIRLFPPCQVDAGKEQVSYLGHAHLFDWSDGSHDMVGGAIENQLKPRNGDSAQDVLAPAVISSTGAQVYDYHNDMPFSRQS